MSFSNRIRSFIHKKANKEAANPASSNPPPPPPTSSETLEALGKQLAQDKAVGETKKEALEKELHELRASMEKLDVTAKSARETHGQTLQFLQQDAEREIKYFERKLKEDMTHWDKQLKEREKNLEQAVKQGQESQDVKKAAQEEV